MNDCDHNAAHMRCTCPGVLDDRDGRVYHVAKSYNICTKCDSIIEVVCHSLQIRNE